jgi:DNA polymerase III subunit chi
MADAAAPCEVWFYHLERSGLDQVLPDLLEKTLARGWKALVRSGDPLRIEHLDGWLWSFRDDSFLPHATAADPHPDRQPVLLTVATEGNPNGANVLFLLDGAAPGALEGFARCVILFDGRDEAALQAARGRWREIKAAGLPGSYWRQSERGSWEKQA